MAKVAGLLEGSWIMHRMNFYGVKRRRFVQGLLALLGALVPGIGGGRGRSKRRSVLREAAFYRRLDQR